MAGDDALDREFREMVESLGPMLVTDDLGVWEFFHGIIQTWDSLGMTEAMDAAIAADEWFREFVDDPLRWCVKIVDQWDETDKLPEFITEWVRANMTTVVEFMRLHDLPNLRLWVNVPGDDWLYMIWDSTKAG